jgi:hypothetical protein
VPPLYRRGVCADALQRNGTQIQGLPTIVFVPVAKDKPALRTEGLLPAETIKKIVLEDLGGAGPA